MDGGEATLALSEVIRAMPIWSWVLCGVSIACLVLFVGQLPEVQSAGSTTYSVTRETMEGRPDRWRVQLAFDMLFYSLGAAVAISAIRERDAWMSVP